MRAPWPILVLPGARAPAANAGELPSVQSLERDRSRGMFVAPYQPDHHSDLGEETMLISKRKGYLAFCLAVLSAAECGGRASGPTSPSGSAGATITGVVN